MPEKTIEILYIADNLSMDNSIISIFNIFSKTHKNVNVEFMEIYDFNDKVKSYDYIFVDFGGLSYIPGNNLKWILQFIKYRLSPRARKVLYIISQVSKFLSKEEIEYLTEAGAIVIDFLEVPLEDLIQVKEDDNEYLLRVIVRESVYYDNGWFNKWKDFVYNVKFDFNKMEIKEIHLIDVLECNLSKWEGCTKLDYKPVIFDFPTKDLIKEIEYLLQEGYNIDDIAKREHILGDLHDPDYLK